ncbi:hypothetical protein Arnit_1145 [Arcobacter nitrofigilis DSM 7299]|uniref:Uncharacterized protein n=1 Tax=Arcobacter nitrofigilis (strain ATCC 33309 / DSM 7299 / CCUG 15893 / LMG 7604 / NCTC 12251 / CI) TaxID=572480 RepID=D5V3X8_ARCNC|nr:phosphate-starvation-inducible PsiE family protein [Arcobacter nitrofigilis]ADG92806.1 hypothetical protein Arnit_1145 [Arcobacter nitrofigilis DSM 7299]
MKKLIDTLNKDKHYIEIILAGGLFLIALYYHMLMDFIIYMLYFVIFLEITRTVINYIREKTVVLSIIVDAFIILTLRELIVNVVKINNEHLDSLEALMSSTLNWNIFIIAGVIVFLLIVRYLSVKTSETYILGKKNKNDHLRNNEL